MPLSLFNFIAIIATLILSTYTIFYSLGFIGKILMDVRKNSLLTTITFLFANVSVLTMIAVLIKQILKGL